MCVLTFRSHAYLKAFLQPAVLASVTVRFGHRAVLGPSARVAQLLTDAPLEEALTALTADGPVVTTWQIHKWKFYQSVH